MGHFRNSSKGKSISLFQLHWSTFGDLALGRSRGLFLVNRVDYGHALLIFHLQHVSLITRSGMDGETILGELKELVEVKVGGNLVVKTMCRNRLVGGSARVIRISKNELVATFGLLKDQSREAR